MSPDAPVLVYDRIDANRRKTRLLVVLFALLAGPAVLAVGGFVLVPLVAVAGTLVLPLLFAVNPYHSEAAMLAWALTAVLASIVLSAGAIVAASRQSASQLLLRLAKARQFPRDQCPTLIHVVEELSIAAGLPVPAVALVDSPVPNAFAVGRDPKTAVIVVTRGLLERTDRRSLAGVIGHELAHIGNQDTRLAGTVAVMTAVLAWPILWPFGLTRSSVGPVRLVGRGLLLLVVLIVFFSMLACAWTVMLMNDPEVVATRSQVPLWWLAFMVVPVVAPMYGLVVAPLAAFRLRSWVSTGREFLADDEAALITRDPGGLALALRTLRDAAGDIPWAASASHLFIADPFGRRPPLWHRWFPTHPPLDVRLARLEEMFPVVGTQPLERPGLPVMATPPNARQRAASATPAGEAPPDSGEEPAAIHHALRRTTQARRRSVSWRDLPASSLLRVLVLTPLGGLMCLSPFSFFTGVPLLAYGAWPLFSVIGERRLVGRCPSCNALLDTGTRGRRPTITCASCQRRVFIEGETFVEGDVSPGRDAPPAEAAATTAHTPGPAVGALADARAVPIYQDPDGWSPVIARVEPGAVLRQVGDTTAGHFVRVDVAGVSGYVSRTAPVEIQSGEEPGPSQPAAAGEGGNR